MMKKINIVLFMFLALVASCFGDMTPTTGPFPVQSVPNEGGWLGDSYFENDFSKVQTGDFYRNEGLHGDQWFVLQCNTNFDVPSICLPQRNLRLLNGNNSRNNLSPASDYWHLTYGFSGVITDLTPVGYRTTATGQFRPIVNGIWWYYNTDSVSNNWIRFIYAGGQYNGWYTTHFADGSYVQAYQENFNHMNLSTYPTAPTTIPTMTVRDYSIRDWYPEWNPDEHYTTESQIQTRDFGYCSVTKTGNVEVSRGEFTTVSSVSSIVETRVVHGTIPYNDDPPPPGGSDKDKLN